MSSKVELRCTVRVFRYDDWGLVSVNLILSVFWCLLVITSIVVEVLVKVNHTPVRKKTLVLIISKLLLNTNKNVFETKFVSIVLISPQC